MKKQSSSKKKLKAKTSIKKPKKLKKPLAKILKEYEDNGFFNYFLMG
jgi:hypothetical protein